MMQIDDDVNAGKLRGIFQELKQSSEGPSPYLKTRVLSEVMSRREKHRHMSFWKSFSLAAASLVVVGTLSFLFNMTRPDFKANVEQAIVVRIDVQDFQKYSLANAEIQLPEGVEFYSENFPEIRNQKTLIIGGDQLIGKTHLAFVVRAHAAGVKSLNVRFNGTDAKAIADKSVKIQFSESSSSS